MRSLEVRGFLRAQNDNRARLTFSIAGATKPTMTSSVISAKYPTPQRNRSCQWNLPNPRCSTAWSKVYFPSTSPSSSSTSLSFA